MSRFQLFLFGPPRLEREGQPIELSLRKAVALLVYLAMTRQPHSRDALATLLWPDSDQRSARASLRRTLHRLQQTLKEGILLVTPEIVSLNSQAALWLDIETYQQHVEACLPQADGPYEFSPDCLTRLTEAAALYRADFLAGFTLPDCPDFDEWQFFQTESLRQSLAQVLTQLVSIHQAEGNFEPAIPYARRWVALDPLYEPAQRQLMQLYDQAGQPAAALRQYEEYVTLLEKELGLPPTEETTTVYEAIKAKRLLSAFIKSEELPGPRTKTPVIALSAGSLTPAASSGHPETHYVSSGDIHIAYQALGQGPVDIVCIGGFVSHLEQMWEEPGLARFFRRLASFSRLILFDKRGMGLSDRVGYPPSLEHTVDDALAVMDAVGSKKAVLFGVSQGGPNSALLAATYPERVLGLILYGALARWIRSPDHPWGWTREQSDRNIGYYTSQWGGPVSLEYFAPSQAADEAFRQWWAKLLRLASSPGGIRAVLEISREIDVCHVLPAIHIPTLVLHRTGDKIIPVEAGQYLARFIPGARFVELPGNDHFWWVGDAEAILAEIEIFLKELRQLAPSSRMLATILLAETVEPGRGEKVTGQRQEIYKEFQVLVEREIARFRGQVAESGDHRLIATFDGPSRAINCALAIRGLAQARGFALRSGLHTGEYELTAGGLGGVAIQTATGVLEQASPHEVLVSSTVKELVRGAGFTFEERGFYFQEEISEAWRLFALKS